MKSNCISKSVGEGFEEIMCGGWTEEYMGGGIYKISEEDK